MKTLEEIYGVVQNSSNSEGTIKLLSLLIQPINQERFLKRFASGKNVSSKPSAKLK